MIWFDSILVLTPTDCRPIEAAILHLGILILICIIGRETHNGDWWSTFFFLSTCKAWQEKIWGMIQKGWYLSSSLISIILYAHFFSLIWSFLYFDCNSYTSGKIKVRGQLIFGMFGVLYNLQSACAHVRSFDERINKNRINLAKILTGRVLILTTKTPNGYFL